MFLFYEEKAHNSTTLHTTLSHDIRGNVLMRWSSSIRCVNHFHWFKGMCFQLYIIVLYNLQPYMRFCDKGYIFKGIVGTRTIYYHRAMQHINDSVACTYYYSSFWFLSRSAKESWVQKHWALSEVAQATRATLCPGPACLPPSQTLKWAHRANWNSLLGRRSQVSFFNDNLFVLLAHLCVCCTCGVIGEWPIGPTVVLLAEKPALDPNAAKMWTLSANDMDDEAVVSTLDLL